MHDSTRPPLRAVPLQITNPERIPSKRYYDDEFYKLECEHLWPHVWQMACRLEEIPRVGDWVEYKILDKSILIVRTKSGIRAFHNACRHRGVKFASGNGNCEAAGFVCPFHGWRWNMDGENTFVFQRRLFSDENLEKADLALVPCRVETWGGCAFINFDDDAASLLESWGPITKMLDARHVDKLRVDWWRQTVLPVNWKTAMEAFMEGYHVMQTHPQLYELVPPGLNPYVADPGDGVKSADPKTTREWLDLTLGFLPRLHSGMEGQVDPHEVAIAESLRTMELPQDMMEATAAFYGRLNNEITKQGRARGVAVPDLNRLESRGVEFLFPHFFLLPMFSAMASYRIRPLGPESCLFDIWSLALYPETEERKPPIAMPVLYNDPNNPGIALQDFSNLPLQQEGLHAKGFQYMRLSRQIEGMISNYHRLIDGYLAGVEPSKLTKATQIVCSGYDAPILDIGF
jgi:carnitine monooxygenase subunit